MNERTDTRGKIVSRATELLKERGYNGFSYNDISGPLGVRNAAIHYHFGSKAELCTELVEQYRELLRSQTSQFMASGGSATEQIEGYFRFCMHECPDCSSLCPLGALAVDFERAPDAVKERAKLLIEETHAWLTRVFEVGKAQGEMSFQTEPSLMAHMLMSTVQGSRTLQRISGHTRLEAVIEGWRAQILGTTAADNSADTAAA